MTYIDEVKSEKKYKGNVIIKIGATYFAINQPDSGLVIAEPYSKMVGSLTLNPTTIDVKKVTTTISSFSFRLVDKSNLISAMVLGDGASLIGQAVNIYLGRSGVAMDFADYFELPQTYIKKIDHPDNTYVFSSAEQTDRMARPLYNYVSALDGDILVGTTTFTMRDDITDFPSTGFLKIDDEFVSYSGKDLVNNRFTGVIRGELNSVPAAHTEDTDCLLVETVTDNPLNIILKILVSGGGGGTYDTLQDGLMIDENLVDVAEIEALRDELFLDVEYTLSLYNIQSALRYIEEQLLAPNNLRFTNSLNSKISLAILDKARFVEEVDVIDEDTITKYPKWSIDGNKITNSIEILWDWSEGEGVFKKRSLYTDATSITNRGLQSIKFEFKGIKTTLDGQNIVDDFGNKLLARLSTPTPEISINTHIDKSLQNIGDKAYLVSSKIPSADGTLNFSSDLEIISRSINQTTGDVSFKLAFTSYTNIRSAFIAPSDLILSIQSQSVVNIISGRGAQYLVGWYMRLWDVANQVYTADPPNKIIAIGAASDALLTEDGDFLMTEDGDNLASENSFNEDSIAFEDAWATTITSPNNYRLRFAEYDDVVDSQKRYGFISQAGNNFADGKPTYKVTY